MNFLSEAPVREYTCIKPGLDLAMEDKLDLLTNLALGRGDPSGSSYKITKYSCEYCIAFSIWFLVL